MNSNSDDSQILTTARKVLDREASGISQLGQELGQEFVQAVEAILAIPQPGRLLLSGMGKAGFVAMKLSATFASTGTPSFFLHPSEAVHGDLGRVSESDLLLVFSNSGETEELTRMLPAVRQVGVKLIAVTTKSESSLARHSDIVLLLGDQEEAGPLGLAPTTSTTVMLALGDALALSVQEQRGFSKEQFAFLHPGGNLGRSLMLISQIMRKADQHCVVPETMLCREVVHRITSTAGRPGAATVVDEAGLVTGIFTDGNLRRCLDRQEDFLDRPVKEFMGKNPKSVVATQLAQEALQLMSQYEIDQVVVVDDAQKPVGMIDIQDFITPQPR